jgi:hypothetical protein
VPSWELCLASFPGVALANDDCRSLGRECRRDSQCCSGNCVRRGDDKVCACPEGRTRCNDRCVNLQRNERHCGRCGNRCAEGEQCVDGVCQGGCPATQICGDSCCTAGESCRGTPAPTNADICCSDDPFCVSANTAAGTPVCITGPEFEGEICTRPICNTDADCSSGEVCVQTFLCDPAGNRCATPC